MAQTPEEIAQHYKAMLDSVALINSIIADDLVVPQTPEEKAAAVDRNVNHLILMRGKDFWGNESMAEVDAAISAGQAYLEQR